MVLPQWATHELGKRFLAAVPPDNCGTDEAFIEISAAFSPADVEVFLELEHMGFQTGIRITNQKQIRKGSGGSKLENSSCLSRWALRSRCIMKKHGKTPIMCDRCRYSSSPRQAQWAHRKVLWTYCISKIRTTISSTKSGDRVILPVGLAVRNAASSKTHHNPRIQHVRLMLSSWKGNFSAKRKSNIHCPMRRGA